MNKIDYAFWTFITVLALLTVFSFAHAVATDIDNNAFIDVCETMNGVAVIGTHGTKACIKSEALK